MPPAVEAWTIRELDHWTIRELLLTLSLKACPWKATGVFGSSESQLPGLLVWCPAINTVLCFTTTCLGSTALGQMVPSLVQ